MTYQNDPYGIGRLKAREMLERERSQKQDIMTEQIVRELKNISQRLQKLEAEL